MVCALRSDSVTDVVETNIALNIGV